jgi:hypothetical protein
MMMQYWNEFLVFFGGIASGLIGHRQFNRTAKKTEMESVVEVYKQLHSEMKASDERCKLELSKVKEDLSALKSQMIIMQSASNDLPFPQWLKDMDLRMVWVNAEYEKAFLRPKGLKAVDYIGKKDSEIWPQEIASEMRKNDFQVMHSKSGYWYGEELIKIEEVNVSTQWKIVKYVRYSGNIPTNIGGMAIPI